VQETRRALSAKNLIKNCWDPSRHPRGNSGSRTLKVFGVRLFVPETSVPRHPSKNSSKQFRGTNSKSRCFCGRPVRALRAFGNLLAPQWPSPAASVRQWSPGEFWDGSLKAGATLQAPKREVIRSSSASGSTESPPTKVYSYSYICIAQKCVSAANTQLVTRWRPIGFFVAKILSENFFSRPSRSRAHNGILSRVYSRARGPSFLGTTSESVT